MSRKKKQTEAPKPETVVAFKGFDQSLKCLGHQFEIGKTYEHTGKVKACKSGFHACEYPLDCFSYYEPNFSRFAVVELSGELSRHEDGSKIAAARIEIKAELSLPSLVSKAVEYIMARIDSTASENEEQSAATNTGNRSAATNTGNWSAATNTGDWSAASAEGKHSVAIASGHECRAKAADGSAIVLVYRGGEGEILHIRCGIAGRDVKPDTFYMLDEHGEFVEVES
jgi:hypothetical protein